MPLAFTTVVIEIPRGTGQRVLSGQGQFPSGVRNAQVALAGFVLDYVSEDHHINLVEVRTELVSFGGPFVTFNVICSYADKNFDDPYQGRVDVLCIAEL